MSLLNFQSQSKELGVAKRATASIFSSYVEAKDFDSLKSGDGTALIQQLDAEKIQDVVPENSIEYAHTDPPVRRPSSVP